VSAGQSRPEGVSDDPIANIGKSQGVWTSGYGTLKPTSTPARSLAIGVGQIAEQAIEAIEDDAIGVCLFPDQADGRKQPAEVKITDHGRIRRNPVFASRQNPGQFAVKQRFINQVVASA
jgi:hypothetical protein